MTSDQCPATRRHTPLYSLEVYGLQCKFTRGHDGDHCGSAGLSTGDVFWPQETMADDAEMLRRHGVERCAICGVVLRSHTGGDHPWTGIEPCASSDEDRIRDAMAEARDHPGRTITR